MKGQPKTWRFELYVAGDSPRSRAALANLERICRSSLGEDYAIEVLDLLQRPELWRRQQVLATPTVIRKAPAPQRRVIGDLSVTEQVLRGLDIPRPPSGPSALAAATGEDASREPGRG